MQQPDKRLTGEEKVAVIKQILIWASLLSILLAFCTGDFQSGFDRVWGYYGAAIVSLLALDLAISSIVKLGEWFNRKTD